MSNDGWATYNVVATYLDVGQAKEAVRALENQKFDPAQISLLSRDASEPVSHEVARDEAEEMPAEVGGNAAKGSLAGAAGGGALGFVAGAAAFGIPGIGPAVGAGIWAAVAGGAAAGATAGGVGGGITKMWEERYRDAVRQGAVLVGVHSDDPGTIDRAAAVLERQGPDRVDRFDSEGKPETG